MSSAGCIVSNFYIKSQRTAHDSQRHKQLYSIQFLHQITTCRNFWRRGEQLYSIQFLHQITTRHNVGNCGQLLYSIQFLHQITTITATGSTGDGCIVSNFYIKSQLPRTDILRNLVVQYPISTSNHNLNGPISMIDIVVQYPISTSNHNTPQS